MRKLGYQGCCWGFSSLSQQPVQLNRLAESNSDSTTGGPEQTPQLLPETNQLPPQPTATPPLRELIPEGSKALIPAPLLPGPAFAEQFEKDKFRFREIRTIAVRNPFAIYLLRRGLSESADLQRQILL